MIETLKIGLIVKPQGIRGQVKVQPLTDDVNRFNDLKEVLIDGKAYRVISATIGGGVVFLSLSNINDRNMAETLRGKFICVTRENALKLEEGRYFVADIIGCDLVADDDCLGEVTEVFSARTDVITVKCRDGRIMRFPYLNKVVIKVDVANKKITVDKKRLLEVACYED